MRLLRGASDGASRAAMRGIRVSTLLPHQRPRAPAKGRHDMADLVVENHGSIFLLDPVTDLGRDWIAAHISADATWFGGGVVVEHRYIRDIVVGAVTDGLWVR